MLVLAGGGLSITGALVVFGALTGRLAAMMAAVFKPADLDASGGWSAANGQTLGQFMTQGLGIPGALQAPGSTTVAPGTTGIPSTIPGSTVKDPLSLLFPPGKAPTSGLPGNMSLGSIN